MTANPGATLRSGDAVYSELFMPQLFRAKTKAGRTPVRKAAFWSALALLASMSPGVAAPAVGQTAPELSGTTIGGEHFDLASLHGKVVLVSYWATWCEPCRKEMPVLDAFYRQHRANGLTLIGISVDRAADVEQARKVGAALSYPVAVLKDIAANGFGTPGAVPVTYVVDADGVVRDRLVAIRANILDDAVLPLLSKPGN